MSFTLAGAGLKEFACQAQYDSLMKYLTGNAMLEPQALLGVVGVFNVNICETHHHTVGLIRPKNTKLTATECILLLLRLRVLLRRPRRRGTSRRILQPV